MTAPLRVGFVGYGYWGPNILRNLARLPDAEVVAASAPADTALAARVLEQFPEATDTSLAAGGAPIAIELES